MTYEAEVQFKFDSTFTPSYGWDADDYIPEEHYLITAPAADLSAKQYFKLFEKFMLCVGMDSKSIRSGAMSLVFNDCVREEDQRKVCNEYDLTMNEDLDDKFKEWKKLDAAFEHHKENVVSEPKDWGRFQAFAKYTDNDLKKMRTMYDTLYSENVDSADGVA
jgi:predicted ATP-dependent Lon-type protease